MAYNLKFDAGSLFRDLDIQLKFAIYEALEQTARSVDSL
jgi:hypothetical protein